MLEEWVAWSVFGSGLFVAGWITGRRSLLQSVSKKTSEFAERYRQGLGFLIQNQPDRALGIFLDHLEIGTDTLELYLTLGETYRRNGEVDRAIRLHQSLLDEQLLKDEKLSLSQWHQIHLALAQDYLAAGLLDRAESIVLALLEQSPDHDMSQLALTYLLDVYEQEKEWQHAIKTAESLVNLGVQGLQKTIAHYRCELAEIAYQDRRLEASKQHFETALQLDTLCIRALLGLARIAFEAKSYRRVLKYLQRLEIEHLLCVPESFAMMEACYRALGRDLAYVQYLEDCLAEHTEEWACLSAQTSECEPRAWYELSGSGSVLATEPVVTADVQAQPLSQHLALWRSRIECLIAQKNQFVCKRCGFKGKALHWMCPSCHKWGCIEPSSVS